MRDGWRRVPARDFIEFNPTTPLKKGTVAKKFAMEHVLPFTRRLSEPAWEEYRGGTKFRNGDTLMARITPCLENGKTAFVDVLENDETAFGSTEFVVLRARDGVSDPFFVYYLATSPWFRDIAIKSMVGSSGRQRVQQGVLENLELSVPSLDKQKKFSSILSSLDDKIETNNKINKNLIQYALLFFNYQYDNMENTERSNLTNIAEYLNGLAVKKYRPKDNEEAIPVLKIREFRQGFCDSESDPCSAMIKNEYIINDGDLIFSWSGSLLVDFWCGGKCALNQHLFKVTPKIYGKWFSYMWTCHHLDTFIAIAEGKATTMGHIKREDLARAEVILPTDEEYAKMDAVLAPIFDAIIQNRVENRKLSSIRDSLLPRLMSGELDVSALDI